MKRVAINGFGRIGQLVLRAIAMHHTDTLDLVAINASIDTKVLAHLLMFDTVHGKFPGTVEAKENSIVVNGKEILLTSERDPAKLPWKKLKIDLVYECTGAFRTKETLQKHIDAGAKKVVLSAPAKDDVDATIVLGVNDNILKKEHKIVSNASCTTTCLAPVAKVIHDNFKIKSGFMTTVHAYTNDQMILDMRHKDLRRARAAAVNIIPTTTGAAKAIGLVIPSLKGVLDGFALRVPIPNASLIDLTLVLDKPTTKEELNATIKKAAENEMKGYIEYSELPLVSNDIIGNSTSAIFDSALTNVNGNLAKIIAWYDNEWGYSMRLVELGIKMVSFK